MTDDLKWMQAALELAFKAEASGEVPVGAVLVGPENQLLGCGYNQVIQGHDPTLHAEIVAIRAAAKQSQNYRLPNTTLYVTLEPCSMCAGALVHARIKRVVFATRDPKSGACGSCFNLLQERALNHRVLVDEGILQEASATLLRHFFKVRR